MPFVLVNKNTSQVLTTQLRNVYDLPYYGVKYWDDRQEAEREFQGFLRQKEFADNDLVDWSLLEVEEKQLKLFNVLLNNNSQKKLFLDDQGKPYTSK